MHAVLLHRNAPPGECLEQLPLCVEGKLGARRHGHGEAEEAQVPLRGDRGIELPERSGRGVPRVGEHRLFGGHARLVELLEAVEGEVDLAADLDHRRRIVGVEPERDVANGAEVGRDVLADRPVAARRAHYQAPRLVREAHGRPIDLELCGVAGALDVIPREPDESLLPVAQLIVVERVAEREHGDEMLVLGELALRGRADALRGRVGAAQLGMRALDLHQLAEHPIVLLIGELGLVEDVVLEVRALELTLQFIRARGELFLRDVGQRRVRSWETRRSAKTRWMEAKCSTSARHPLARFGESDLDFEEHVASIRRIFASFSVSI